MKPILAWMKANVPIVVLSAVILLILPAALVGSYFWNKSIRTSRQATVDKTMGDLAALRITYALPATTAGGQPQLVPMDAPNSKATEFFKEYRGKLDAEIAKVADAAKTINQAGHKLLVEGLFKTPPPPPEGQPAPATTEPPKPTEVDQLKAVELAELIVGRPDRPSVYEALLKGINAGGPADAVKVAESLREEQTRFQDTVRAQHNRDKLTDEEQAELTKKLVALRIAQYQRQARDISVYATADCLPSDIPRVVPSPPPDAVGCYQLQYDYWLVSDLLRAVGEANRDAAGRPTSVADSVVKRVEKIRLLAPETASEASVTGRKNGPENKLYDVRDAELSLIVASSGLPALVNAVSRTNFMTVLDMDFSDADPWGDVDKGFYYGQDHVVKVSMRVETIWLRSWTEAYMPQQLKDQLTAASDASAAAPSAAPTAGRVAAPPPAAAPPKPPPKGSTKRPTGRRNPGGDGGGG